MKCLKYIYKDRHLFITRWFRFIRGIFSFDLSESQQKKVKDFTNPFPVREISLLYNRPYAKLRLIETLSKEIQQLIRPVLSTNGIDKDEMNVLPI